MLVKCNVKEMFTLNEFSVAKKTERIYNSGEICKNKKESASTNNVQVIVYCFIYNFIMLKAFFRSFSRNFSSKSLPSEKCSIFKQNNKCRVLLSPLISRNAERGKLNFQATQISRWSSCMLLL